MALGLNPRSSSRGNLLVVDAANPASLATNIRRNLLTFPEDFTNAVWVKQSGNSVQANTHFAPDGTFTADTLLRTGGAEEYQNFPCILGTTYTFSLYIRTDSAMTAQIKLGRVSSNPQQTTVCTLSSAWTRFSVTFTADITGVGFANIDTTTAGRIQIWGAQLEVGSTPTNYYNQNTPESALNTLWKDLTATNRNYNSDLTAVEVLVVGGGGAGGAGNNNGYEAGGGGGGGVVYNTAFPVTATTSYPVVVGAGGQAIPGGAITPTGDVNNNGDNSSFSTLIAFGGGAGGIGGFSGKNGGCGGGGAYAAGTARSRGGVSPLSQGFAGGIGAQSQLGDGTNRGGGGGGAGGVGIAAVISGNGGPGATYSISGSAVVYAAGGGGNLGVGGTTGAGQGALRGTSGVDGFGHGGGAASWDGVSADPAGRGGNGGAGTVIIRYPAPQRATGGIVTAVGGNIIHTFPTGTGTFTVTASNEDPRAWGILTNGPTYDFRNSGSLNFDNLDDYVDFPSLSPITDSELSCFAWVYLNATPTGTNGIWGHFGGNYNGANNNCHFEMNPTGTRIRLGQVNKADLPALTPLAWTQVGFTSTGTSHSYYVNGVLSTTWTGNTATTSISASSSNSFTVTHATSTLSRVQEGTYVTISGATPAQFNGTWLVTSSTSGSFTVIAPVSPANASVQGTITFGTGTLLGTTPRSHFIGRSDATRTWNGRIGYVAVSNVALTAAEISSNFNALRGRYGI